jgi:hypothetical protein
MKSDLKIFILVGVISLALAGILSFPTNQAQATDQSQTINLTVTTTLTFSLATGTVSLGTLTPGTPIIATTSCNVTTNSSAGWQLSVKRNNADYTLKKDGTGAGLPDYTAWNGSNSTSTPGATLSFRVYQTGTTPSGLYNTGWWGTNDSSPLWAGFPTASQAIASINSYQSGQQTVVYGFRVDAPADQPSGAYSGNITLTALSL